MTEWWQYALLWTGCTAFGSAVGVGVAHNRLVRQAVRTNDRYVRPRCLRVGHDWLRLEGVPFQFCHRLRCTGARVSPWMVEKAPAELVAEMEQVIDRNGDALSQDRQP